MKLSSNRAIDERAIVERMKVQPAYAAPDDSYRSRLIAELIVVGVFVMAVCGLLLCLNSLIPKGY